MDVVNKVRRSLVVKRRIPTEILNVEDLFRVRILVEAVLPPKIPNPRQGAYPGAGEGRKMAGRGNTLKQFGDGGFRVDGCTRL